MRPVLTRVVSTNPTQATFDEGGGFVFKKTLVAMGATTALVAMTAAGAIGAGGVALARGRAPAHHYTIALSLGYVANGWQKEAENLTIATSKVAPYKKMVTLKVYIAGQNVENQISQVQDEISSGVNAIILYPLSPTALAPVVKQACGRGIKVFTYDAQVKASCAYQLHIPYVPSRSDAWGAMAAKWLVHQLRGHGNVVMITGVPGVSQDTWNVASAMKVFHGAKGIHVVAKEVGLWNQAVAKTKMAQVLASHGDINGIWVENGCYGAEEGVLEAHHKPIPCAGNSSNGHRLMMLPKSKGGLGVPSISIGTGVNEGALSLVHAVEVLEGKHLPHQMINPIKPLMVTNAQLKMGVNVFKNSQVGGPGFMDDIHNPAIPKAADTVHAALTGNPS